MDKDFSTIDGIIISFLTGKISLKEKEILENWLASSSGNKEYFKHIYKIWYSTGIPDKNASNTYNVLQKLKFRLKLTPFSRKKSVIKLYSLGKWAAVILISLASGAFIYSYLASHSKKTNRILTDATTNTPQKYDENKRNTTRYHTITVPMGAKSEIRLPDGTEITLNAGSKLTYNANYGILSRDVDFSGEGYFKVAKNKEKPFIVHTSNANIKALGTEFNVKAYPDENIIETILVEGAVVVNEISFSKNDNSSENLDSILLKPGQKVLIYKIPENTGRTIKFIPQKKDKEVIAVQKVQPSNPEIETSWKDKRWIIQGENLQNLSVMLSRKFDVHIKLEDPELNKYKFSGIIENETIEQVFQIMKYTIPISYTINKGEVTWSINRNLEKDYEQAY